MANIFGLVITIVIFCCAVTARAEPSNTCGLTYNQTSGKIHYSNGSSSSVPAGIKPCKWIITFNVTNTTQEVFLVFEEFRLFGKDSLKISQNVKGEEKPLGIGPFNGERAMFSVLTGVQNITVELTTTADVFTRKFEMFYYTTLGCTHKLASEMVAGTFQSPIYEVNRNSTFNCSFFFASHATKDAFKLATTVTPLQPPLDDVQLNIIGSEELAKTYTGLYSAMAFTSKAQFNVTLIVKPNQKALRQVEIAFEAVTSECSGMKNLEKGGTYTFTNPTSTAASVKETASLNCRYIVFTDDSGIHALTVAVGAHSLPGSLDQLQVTNSMGKQTASILQLTSSNEKEWEDQYVMTNGQNLSISLLSSFPSPKMNVSITIGTAANGGYFEDNGTIGFSSQESNPAIFLLKVDPKKQVKLELAKTYKEGNLKLFYNFEKNGTAFAELDKMRNASAFISPSPLMMIQASNFGKDPFSAKFESVERGCFSASTDDIGSYNLFGKCVPICTWTVAGKTDAAEKDLRKLDFSSFVLKADDNVLLIMQTDSKPLANVTGPVRSMPDFYLPAKDGFNVIVRRNCSTDETAVVADYAPAPGCERNVTLETGKSLTLSSPGYPNSYPVRSDCLWKISPKAKTDLIHVSFKSLQLGGVDHTLTLTMNTLTEDKLLLKLVGPTLPNATLPRDYVVDKSANLTVDFQGGAYDRAIADSVYGFQITLTAADCGGQLMSQSGSFGTPGKGNTTDAKLCFWLVGVDSNKTKSIILYNTNTSAKGYLQVHEGASVRDQVRVNLTGPNETSRLDRLLFVYRNPNTTAGPAVSVSFSALACNLSCGNGVCMHPDWICNDVNDCGDWSDEKNCNGTCPSPAPPGPTPTPPPLPSPAGVSSGTLAGGILGALLIGALMGFLVPVFLNWYRSRPSTEYSTLIGASG